MGLTNHRHAPFRRLLGALCLTALVAGCDETPTSGDRRDPHLEINCFPRGIQVECAAILFDVPEGGARVDITSEATWLVSDPALGEFLAPGLFTPRQRGDVELSARYEQWEAFVSSWFLVDPLQPAQRLYFLSGFVRDDESNATLSGATVEILDGHAQGRRAVTNENGHYRIDHILTGEPFSVKASMPGYSPSTLSYRVDSPYGPPGNSPFLDFRLRAEEGH